MVRDYKTKKKISYSQEDLERALESVRFGGKFLRAAKVSKVPHQTLQNILKRGVKGRNVGGQTIFTIEQELSLKIVYFT